MTRNTITAAFAALVAVSFTGAVQAQSAMSHSAMSHPKMSGSTMHQKMSPKAVVGYCAQCKTFYSKSDTVKMGMKDSMGHKMTMAPISKVPTGTTMGHMSHHKM